MTISMEDLQYEKDPYKRLQQERDEIVRQCDEGELTEEEAQDAFEKLDELEGKLDEAGPPPWADDADDPQNSGAQLPD